MGPCSLKTRLVIRRLPWGRRLLFRHFTSPSLLHSFYHSIRISSHDTRSHLKHTERERETYIHTHTRWRRLRRRVIGWICYHALWILHLKCVLYCVGVRPVRIPKETAPIIHSCNKMKSTTFTCTASQQFKQDLPFRVKDRSLVLRTSTLATSRTKSAIKSVRQT